MSVWKGGSEMRLRLCRTNSVDHVEENIDQIIEYCNLLAEENERLKQQMKQLDVRLDNRRYGCLNL